MNSNDPRLTAYAMGELHGADLAEVEAAIKAQPELQSAVEEIRSSAALFKAAFHSEDKPTLSARQRQRVLNLPGAAKKPSRTFWLAASGLAAGVASFVIYTGTHPKKAEPVAESTAVTEVYLADSEADTTAIAASEESIEFEKEEASDNTFGKAALKAKKVLPEIHLQTNGPEEARRLLNSLERELRGCASGQADFNIDPAAKTVQAVNDHGDARNALCWTKILSPQNWPGTKPYQVQVKK